MGGEKEIFGYKGAEGECRGLIYSLGEGSRTIFYLLGGRYEIMHGHFGLKRRGEGKYGSLWAPSLATDLYYPSTLHKPEPSDQNSCSHNTVYKCGHGNVQGRDP